MRSFPLRLLGLLLLCILTFVDLHAQDKIYSGSDVTTCKIIDINTTTVTYLPLRSSKSLTMYVNKVILLFNSKGVYMRPSKLDFSLKQSQQLVKKFLQDESITLTSDQVYTTDNKVVNGQISKVDKNFIYLDKDEKKVDKRLISAIIYKDGKHEIFGPVTKAADVLWSVYESDKGSTTLAQETPAKDPVVKTAGTPKEINAADTSKAPSSPNAVQQANLASTETQTAALNSGKPAQTNGDTANAARTPTAPSTKPSINDALTPPLVKEFEQKAGEKTIQFSNYLIRLLDKQVSDEEKNKVIAQAAKLFVNDDAIVEVSSLNRAPERPRIKSYLNKLKFLNYDKVELIWTNVQYVTELKKGMDGNYSGTVTFEQKFNGYKDGKLVYGDITIKKAIVYLRTYEKNVDGKAEVLWDVLMGDIGVESTTAPNS